MGTIDNKPPAQGGTGPTGNTPPAPPSTFGQFLSALENQLNTQLQTLDKPPAPTTEGNKDTFSAVQGGFSSTVANAVSTPGSPVLRSAEFKKELDIGVSSGAAPAKTTGMGNKWMQNLGQAVYLEAMRYVANIQSKMKLTEVLSIVKQTIANQSNIEAQAANIQAQAMIEFISAIVQAVVQIASAAIAVGIAAKSAGSGVSAQKSVRKENDALRENPKCKDAKQWVNDKHDYNVARERHNNDTQNVGTPKHDKETQRLDKENARLNETQPGYQQFGKYTTDNTEVKISDTKTTKGDVTTTKNPLHKDNQPVKKDEIIITKDQKDSNDSEQVAKNKIAEDGKTDRKAQYDKMHNENGMEFQKAVGDKIQINSTINNQLSQINQTMSQAVVGLVKATFDLQAAGTKEAMVYIQAMLDMAKSLIDLSNQMHSSQSQNLDSIYSSIQNTLQIFGQINKYGA